MYSALRPVDRCPADVRSRDTVASALRVALAAAKPIRTCARLARACGCSRITLWRHWRDSGAREICTPNAMLDAIALARAHRIHQGGVAWHRAAVELGIDQRTLDRIRDDFGDVDPETFLRRFETMLH